jgi:hypothetical protein
MRPKRGLTVAEIILAMAVASLSVIGIASLITSVYRAVKDGKYQAVGSTLARQEIERLRGDKDDLVRLVNLPGPETRIVALPVGDQETAFNCTLRAVYAPSMENRYLDLTCAVRWEQHGMVREVRLETLLPKP